MRAGPLRERRYSESFSSFHPCPVVVEAWVFGPLLDGYGVGTGTTFGENEFVRGVNLFVKSRLEPVFVAPIPGCVPRGLCVGAVGTVVPASAP